MADLLGNFDYEIETISLPQANSLRYMLKSKAS